MSVVEVLVALAIAFGLAGILVPILPGGSLLVAAAVLVWALWIGTSTGWIVFAIAAVVLAGGITLKYAVPGRRLKGAGVPFSTQLVGALLAIIGFFVIPVIGLVIGFVLGVLLAEYRRLRDGAAAWRSTKHALRAVGLAILIELVAGVAATATWVTGVVLT